VSDGAADGAGEGESRVQLEAAELRLGRVRLGGHFVCFSGIKEIEKLSGVVIDARRVARVKECQLDLARGLGSGLLAMSLFGKSEVRSRRWLKFGKGDMEKIVR
jgi:hypothetical protein